MDEKTANAVYTKEDFINGSAPFEEVYTLSSLVKGTSLADFHANLQCLVPTPAQGSRPNIFLFTG